MAIFKYRFQFADDQVTEITSPLPALKSAPEWTRLTFHQCPKCPLSPADSAHCPMALSLAPLVEATHHRQSIDPVVVRVETQRRHYERSTNVQAAASSLMGLLSARSGCPHTEFLSGLAEFHLPFSDMKETLFRVVSSYLLVQYLVGRRGGNPDWKLVRLKEHYDTLRVVNYTMADRLRAASSLDGTINALVMLDSLGKTLMFSIEDALEDIQPAFSYYLDKESGSP